MATNTNSLVNQNSKIKRRNGYTVM